MSDKTAKEYASTSHKDLPESKNTMHQLMMGSGEAYARVIKNRMAKKTGGKK